VGRLPVRKNRRDPSGWYNGEYHVTMTCKVFCERTVEGRVHACARREQKEGPWTFARRDGGTIDGVADRITNSVLSLLYGQWIWRIPALFVEESCLVGGP
jgi:hypothetical protein